MASFYYNLNSKENILSQWYNYIQNNEYVSDITKSVGQQTKEISGTISNQTKDITSLLSQQKLAFNNTIQQATSEQIHAIKASTNAVCGSIDIGFNLISDHLNEISFGFGEMRSEINTMSSMLDWKLTLLVEQQRITNLLLGNLAKLLRIPDIQKERQYHIEQGIKFLKNAIYDNDFYIDSFTNLNKAEQIEPTDFFVLHKIGLIYMYSIHHLNIPKAEEYFKKSAKYAIAETNTGAIKSKNYLNEEQDDPYSAKNIKIQAAEAYLFAGRCCYIQGKFDEAAKLAGTAFNLVPQMLEAGYTQAKSLSANNNESQAATVLEQVIREDRFYSLKIISDLDLSPKKPILQILKKLHNEAFIEAIEQMSFCQFRIQSNSQGNNLLKRIEQLLENNNYLASKQAIDLLNKKFLYSLDTFDIHYQILSINSRNLSLTLEELINYENFLTDNLEKINALITKNASFEKLNDLYQKITNLNSTINKESFYYYKLNLENKKYKKIQEYGIITLIIGVLLLIISLVIYSKSERGYSVEESKVKEKLFGNFTLFGILLTFISLFMRGKYIDKIIDNIQKEKKSEKEIKYLKDQKNNLIAKKNNLNQGLESHETKELFYQDITNDNSQQNLILLRDFEKNLMNKINALKTDYQDIT